jgi:hypothetical protein
MRFYVRLEPTRASSLIRTAGLLLMRRLAFVDEDGDEDWVDVGELV